MNVTIWGIIYGDKQTEYTPIRNDKPAKPWRWENDPMISIVDNNISDLNDNDLLGIFSYKFRDSFICSFLYKGYSSIVCF